MAKRPLRRRVRLLPYTPPRLAWRLVIHRVVAKALRQSHVAYTKDDRFEVSLRLYFETPVLQRIDIDNRLKDVLDALQGHVGGAGKKQRRRAPIIPNDSQVYRAVVEKSLPPKQSWRGWGHLTITKYKGPRFG